MNTKENTSKTRNNATKRVQVYLTNKVYDDFNTYCKDEGVKPSKAIEQLLNIALSQKQERCPVKDSFQKDLEELKARVSDLEKIIRTNDYLEQQKIPQDAMRVEEQDF